jgi:predicted ester cyclase
MFAEKGIANGLADDNGNPLRGPENFKPFFRKFRAAFPDIKVIVEDTVCEGDKVAALCKVVGTDDGDSLGISSTNQPIEFSGICIVRIKDVKIVEAWNHFDFLTMYQQINAVAFK